MNFSNHQLPLLIKEAHKNDVKIYVTLNTVIKNSELGELIQQIHLLNEINPDAVIIQDWGVSYIIKKYFPKLTIHASTQMGHHNSAGASHAEKSGFERVILARELTMKELQQTAQNTTTPLEIFVHGALCYSFSGMCLFSSYMGGAGANRGLCTQPCRRMYDDRGDKAYYFSLKDNQQASHIQEIAKYGITSLKIEGRMKSASYVNKVAKAYRMALDNPENLNTSLSMLKDDLGRDKTGYFLDGKVKDAITHYPNTGKLIGKVIYSDKSSVTIEVESQPDTGSRLFIRVKNRDEQYAVKVRDEDKRKGNNLTIKFDQQVTKGSEVFLASTKAEKFPSKLPDEYVKLPAPFNRKKEQEIIRNVQTTKKQKQNRETVFLRINDLGWLRKIRLEYLDGLILNLPANEWSEFNPDAGFLRNNNKKIWIELPKFISETNAEKTRAFCKNLYSKGFRNFYLSHLSQKEYLPKEAYFATNENVYVYNDAAATMIESQGARFWTSPHENEMENLLAGKHRNALVPMYYYPELFYSRMPVDIKQDSEEVFTDSTGAKFRKRVHDGITIVIPEIPVALFQYKQKLTKQGFSNFLIDLSWQKPSSNTLKKLMLRLKNSQQVQPSNTFNFKKGLK
jgi:putative protease